MRDRLGHRPGGGRVFRLRGTGVFAHARLCSGVLLRPAEGLAGDQHAMQDHRQLARQRLTGGERAVGVLHQAVNRSAKGEAELLGESCGCPPAHGLEREDIGEAVPEQEHVGGRVRSPRPPVWREDLSHLETTEFTNRGHARSNRPRERYAMNKDLIWKLGLFVLILLALNFFFHLHIAVISSVVITLIIWFVFRMMSSKS